MKLPDRHITSLVDRILKHGLLRTKNRTAVRVTLYRWMKEGRLKLRRKKTSGYFLVNEYEIKQILKEFSKGGKGYYFANETD